MKIMICKQKNAIFFLTDIFILTPAQIWSQYYPNIINIRWFSVSICPVWCHGAVWVFGYCIPMVSACVLRFLVTGSALGQDAASARRRWRSESTDTPCASSSLLPLRWYPRSLGTFFSLYILDEFNIGLNRFDFVFRIGKDCILYCFQFRFQKDGCMSSDQRG